MTSSGSAVFHGNIRFSFCSEILLQPKNLAKITCYWRSPVLTLCRPLEGLWLILVSKIFKTPLFLFHLIAKYSVRLSRLCKLMKVNFFFFIAGEP